MDSVKTPVSGGGAHQGEPDGVSGAPKPGDGADIDGRLGGGESDGGAYPNPHTGRDGSNSGFMGHGGQTEMAYHGSGQAGGDGGTGPNAATGSTSSDEAGTGVAASPEHAARAVTAGDRTVSVVEVSGIAEAEANGKIATDAPYEREQEAPGSG